MGGCFSLAVSDIPLRRLRRRVPITHPKPKHADSSSGRCGAISSQNQIAKQSISHHFSAIRTAVRDFGSKLRPHPYFEQRLVSSNQRVRHPEPTLDHNSDDPADRNLNLEFVSRHPKFAPPTHCLVLTSSAWTACKVRGQVRRAHGKYPSSRSSTRAVRAFGPFLLHQEQAAHQPPTNLPFRCAGLLTFHPLNLTTRGT